MKIFCCVFFASVLNSRKIVLMHVSNATAFNHPAKTVDPCVSYNYKESAAPAPTIALSPRQHCMPTLHSSLRFSATRDHTSQQKRPMGPLPQISGRPALLLWQASVEARPNHTRDAKLRRQGSPVRCIDRPSQGVNETAVFRLAWQTGHGGEK